MLRCPEQHYRTATYRFFFPSKKKRCQVYNIYIYIYVFKSTRSFVHNQGLRKMSSPSSKSSSPHDGIKNLGET